MDLGELFEEIEKPDKFGGWFKKNFDCQNRKSNLYCEIGDEEMKIQNSVKTTEYQESDIKNMLKAVIQNHKINKEAGITGGKNGNKTWKD